MIFWGVGLQIDWNFQYLLFKQLQKVNKKLTRVKFGIETKLHNLKKKMLFFF
jgi:hypothetical protein